MANRDTNIAEEGADLVREGHVYKEDSGTKEVIPFFVDFARSTVRFAPVGVASGREDEMRTSDFLNRFTYVGQHSSLAEPQTEKKDTPEGESTARRVSRDAGTVDKPRATRVDKEA